jgi:hypothetical protein
LFFICSGDDAAGLLTKLNSSGAWQFPNLNLSTGGEILPGISVIISNALPAGTAVLVDASGLLLADGGFVLDIARQTSLQLNTTPDSPPTARGIRRLAIMANVDAPAAYLEMEEVQAAARSLGVETAHQKFAERKRSRPRLKRSKVA